MEQQAERRVKKPHFGKKETVSFRKEEYEEGLQRKWRLVDASTMPLGRLASKVASVLRGKHYPYYTPHVDCGDFVVVINADKVVLTGNKLNAKYYYRHTGYIGGIKEVRADALLAKKPEELFYQAVKRMMPRSKMNRKALLKLKIFAGEKHPYGPQKPEPMHFEKIEHLKS